MSKHLNYQMHQQNVQLQVVLLSFLKSLSLSTLSLTLFLGFGIGVVPKIVLDNSPLVERIKILDVQPALKPYEIGLYTLTRSLKNPLIEAFWELS